MTALINTLCVTASFPRSCVGTHRVVNWNKSFQQYIGIQIDAGQQNSLMGVGFELCIPTQERGNEVVN
jgi:hypothetical protein